MKINKRGLKLVLVLGFFLTSVNVFSQDPNFYIYLCFGQSNMDGQGTIESMDRTVNNRFKVMQAVSCSGQGRVKGSWYTATPPLCRCYSGLSPADYFGRTLVANLPDSIKVGIINVSVAGCKIELFDKDNYQSYVSSVTEDWLKNIIAEYSGNPYAYLVNAAKLAQKDGVIKGILLHQGESNTGDIQWPSKVKKIYNDLIADLSLEAAAVPLLAGEVVNADQGGVCASMNSIIAKLPQTIPNSYVISSKACTDADDNIHFNSAGYRKIGTRYGIKMLSLLGYEVAEPENPIVPVVPDPKGTESLWFEAERFVTPKAGIKFSVISDVQASNGKYLWSPTGVQTLTAAPADSSGLISIPFTVSKDTTYILYARLNCPSADDDSYWIKLDNGPYTSFNGLVTSGWAWLRLTSFFLKKGQHKLTLGYREDGAKLDKIAVSSYGTIPAGLGGADNLTVGLKPEANEQGFVLEPNFPNPFCGKTSISFEIPEEYLVSLKIYNLYGAEIAELAGKKYPQGKYTVEFSSGNLPDGIYFYKMKSGKYTESKKMILKK